MTAKPRLLFVSLTNDLGSDRLVSEFGRRGAVCGVIGPVGCYAGLSRFVSDDFDLPSQFGTWAATVGLQKRLQRIATEWTPDSIIPLDELAAVLLRSIGAAKSTASHLRALIVHSLGRPYGYDAACHRLPLMVAARHLGVRVPDFCEASQAGSDIPFPIVVKRDHSSGSGGVTIVRDFKGLSSAVGAFRVRQAAKKTLATLAGHRNSLGPILLQQHVEGALAMHTVACRDGMVLDGISFTAVQIHPAKRASTMLQRRDNAEMAEAARRIVEALGCSGFVSFDFIVDRDDRAFLIEMNPRPIGSTHLGRLFGHDLCQAFLDGSDDQHDQTHVLADDQIIALFPKELERDPESRCLDRASGIIHDVPLDEPFVVDAYLRHLRGIHPARNAEHQQRLGAAQLEADQPSWDLVGLPAQ